MWKDKLLSVGGSNIYYDANGNPTYYNGEYWNWEKGRQLTGSSENEYIYNKDGIRMYKNVGGVNHSYTLDGTNIIREQWAQDVLIPLYDLDGTVCGIDYNGTAYYFYKNLQGDVIAITDDTGATVAKYRYDAWGKCTIVSDSTYNGFNEGIATINPFRYRSYYYDNETGWYYLQSRYYDPNVGRFINADDTKFLLKNNIGIAANLYSYCNNNCINGLDVQGTIAFFITAVKIAVIIAAIITGILVGIKAVQKLHKTKKYQNTIGGGKFLQTVIYFLLGFMSGSIMFAVYFVSGQLRVIIINCASSVSMDVMKATMDGKNVTVKTFVEYCYEAYTDAVGWSFLNEIFEKGLIKVIKEKLNGTLEKKFFDLIEENE